MLIRPISTEKFDEVIFSGSTLATESNNWASLVLVRLIRWFRIAADESAGLGADAAAGADNGAEADGELIDPVDIPIIEK